jgi:hypothetical protein
MIAARNPGEGSFCEGNPLRVAMQGPIGFMESVV